MPRTAQYYFILCKVMVMLRIIIIITFIQYMKQIKKYKSHKKWAIKPGKK